MVGDILFFIIFLYIFNVTTTNLLMSERLHLHQIPCRDYPFFNYRYFSPAILLFHCYAA